MFYYDQDMINFCFKGRILELDTRWNLQNAEPAHEVFNPAIVHYSANPKPWFVWSRVAFKRTYRHLMTNSYFYQYRRERVARLQALVAAGLDRWRRMPATDPAISPARSLDPSR